MTLERLLGGGSGDGNEQALCVLRQLRRDFPQAVETAAIDCRYAGYVAREQASAARLRELEDQPIPAWVDYRQVPHLRAEARERLEAIGPGTLGQALRISGITPADITVLMVHLGRRRRRQASERAETA